MRAHLVLLLLLTLPAFAEAPRAALLEAQALLKQGDPAAALEAYRALQVEHPEAEQVIFGIGYAQRAQAKAAVEAKNKVQAAELLAASAATYERLQTAGTPPLRASAGFNRGNALLQQGKLLDTPEEYPQSVQALREAVAAFEAVLAQAPEHTQAHQNLNHARYVLQQRLQQPPENPDQEKQDPQDPNNEPQAVSVINEASTEIPGAQARPEENRVELVLPGAGRAAP